MIVVTVLIFIAALSFIFWGMLLWQFLGLSEKLDNLMSAVFVVLPVKVKKWTASYLLIEVLNGEARSFFFWVAMLVLSVSVYLISGAWWVVASYALSMLMVINKKKALEKRNNRAAVRQLPDFCDLISMMIASGVPLISALEKVSDSCSELLLAREIRAMLSRLRRGASFPQSMKELSERYNANELKEWSSMLVKGYQQGASLTKSLRFYANQLRQELLNSAEKRAQEAPVKLLFPLVTCFFPVNFLVILGPVIVQLSQGGFG
ncbi:type II secretion system F family protein [Idiomarina aminovorans]|uniref:type II secretion system F family protein n=1 Tax=Idiomarina aminovorans TaxID=2914829 RepID=UPI002003BD08|nr:type II secretion system F family protein [Idiomarina sp. ATCH4]MCK7458280.1 type II secretion system F family protein [Idiomarina sp. ATCH4]